MKPALFLVVLATMAQSCGDTEDPQPQRKQREPTAEEVHRKRPLEITEKLEFRKVVSRNKRVSGLVPAAWKKGPLDVYKPNRELGFMTSMTLGVDCAGACVSKDWKSVVDAKMEAIIGSAKLLKDESLPESNGRLVVTKGRRSAHVAAMWWRQGGSHYVTCHAWLDDEVLAEAVAEFENACRATQILSWE